MTTVDLTRPTRIHVVGVGGAGMSAVAEVLHSAGHRVSGSDRAPSAVVDRLERLGLDVHVGHDPEAVRHAQLLTASTAVGPDDPEVAAAVALGIPVLRRAEILSALCGLRRTAAVSGTHGKTTTTALLGAALGGGGRRPSWIVGAELRGLGSGARWDDGEWLVVEADESDGTMVELPVQVAVLTSVEPDHLEHYGDFDALVAAFERFLTGATELAVVCVDDPVAAELAGRVVGRGAGLVTYGTSSSAEYRMAEVTTSRATTAFTLEHRGLAMGTVEVPMAGWHNARNAAAAVVVATLLGVPLEMAAAGVAVAPAVARRFEVRAVAGGVTFVDDYAHLPGEVAAVLDTARRGGWERIVGVFQPHRFSRTEALWEALGRSLGGVDALWVTDVYGAGEAPRPGITGELVARAARRTHPGLPVRYQPDRHTLVAELREELRDGDLCLVMGAGDLTDLFGQLATRP